MAEELSITASDLIESKHSYRDMSLDVVLLHEKAIRKASSRLASEVAARSSYLGTIVVSLNGGEDGNDPEA